MRKQEVDYRGGEGVVSMAKILQTAAHVGMEIAMMTIEVCFVFVWVVPRRRTWEARGSGWEERI